MKMNGLFFGGLFWGILISLIGLSMILRYALNIHFPIVRLFLGIIIILFGLKLIVGHSGRHTFKRHGEVYYRNNSSEITILFSNGTVDFSRYMDSQKFPKEIAVIFGSATILVPDSLNLDINSTTVFGSTRLPDRSYAGFGEDNFSMNNKPGSPVHMLETSTIFGKLDFEVVHSESNINEPKDSTKTENNF
jgi:predicted membrane protein